jgi:hypothetical protein
MMYVHARRRARAELSVAGRIGAPFRDAVTFHSEASVQLGAGRSLLTSPVLSMLFAAQSAPSR